MERVFDVLFSGFALVVPFPFLVSIAIILRCIGESEIMGYSGEYFEAPTYPGSVSRRCPEISRAKTVFGYNPQIDWRVVLVPAVEWYKTYFSKKKLPRQDGFQEQEKFN